MEPGVPQHLDSEEEHACHWALERAARLVGWWWGEKCLQVQSAPVNVSPPFQDSPDSDDESKLLFLFVSTHCAAVRVLADAPSRARALSRASRCSVLSVSLNPDCELMPVPCLSDVRRYNLVKAFPHKHEIPV